jgi:nucleoid-associated protein YgaU
VPVLYPRCVTVTSETNSESTEGGPPSRDNRVAHPAAAFATQRLCPYLVADGSEWRSASPSRDHRCGAVAPPVPLAVDKQRRLCLTNRHVGCPTFLAAADQPGRAVGSGVPDPSQRSTRRAGVPPGGETVTRWSIVRTVPVLLDGGRLSSTLTSVGRLRAQPQLILVALLLVAFVAIAAARLSGGGPATPGGAQPRGSAVAIVPGPSVVPSAESEPSAVPSAATPSPTLPTTAESTRTYKVKRGDTLYVIARRFGTTVSTIQRLNHLGNSTTLHAGQVLKLP